MRENLQWKRKTLWQENFGAICLSLERKTETNLKRK